MSATAGESHRPLGQLVLAHIFEVGVQSGGDGREAGTCGGVRGAQGCADFFSRGFGAAGALCCLRCREAAAIHRTTRYRPNFPAAYVFPCGVTFTSPILDCIYGLAVVAIGNAIFDSALRRLEFWL